MICAYSTIYAQQLSVKSVNLRPQDARARTNPRDDAKGKKCAIYVYLQEALNLTMHLLCKEHYQ